MNLRHYMPDAASSPQQRPGDAWTELHQAAKAGSTQRTVALLSTGSADIDRKAPPQGATPLMAAAGGGYLRLVRILLNNGADLSKKDYKGATALHFSARGGHVALTKMLIREGADVHAATKELDGQTPLHLAAGEGHSEVVRMLVDAGANPDCRSKSGQTPLFMAMTCGHLDATRALLRAKADPSLAWMGESGRAYLPLDIAASGGHIDVMREMVQQLGIKGIKGCGGQSEGLGALYVAAQREQLGVMAMLTDAGVIDDGTSLVAAADVGNEAGVKFLLEQQEKRAQNPDYCCRRRVAYVDTVERGMTALVACIECCRPCSPKIVQLLVEAGADTTSPVGVPGSTCEDVSHHTPLALTTKYRDEKMIDGEPLAIEQLNTLETIRRLLLRVEAVLATSWLWPSDVPVVVQAVERAVRTSTTSTPLRKMLPALRRRAIRRDVVSAALSR